MSIVYVYSYLIRQIFKSAVNVHVAHNDVAHRSRAHKILLAKAQSLAFKMVIVRVKHLGQRMSDIAGSERACVIARVESAHIKGHALCAPESEL